MNGTTCAEIGAFPRESGADEICGCCLHKPVGRVFQGCRVQITQAGKQKSNRNTGLKQERTAGFLSWLWLSWVNLQSCHDEWFPEMLSFHPRNPPATTCHACELWPDVITQQEQHGPKTVIANEPEREREKRPVTTMGHGQRCQLLCTNNQPCKITPEQNIDGSEPYRSCQTQLETARCSADAAIQRHKAHAENYATHKPHCDVAETLHVRLYNADMQTQHTRVGLFRVYTDPVATFARRDFVDATTSLGGNIWDVQCVERHQTGAFRQLGL